MERPLERPWGIFCSRGSILLSRQGGLISFLHPLVAATRRAATRRRFSCRLWPAEQPLRKRIARTGKEEGWRGRGGCREWGRAAGVQSCRCLFLTRARLSRKNKKNVAVFSRQYSGELVGGVFAGLERRLIFNTALDHLHVPLFFFWAEVPNINFHGFQISSWNEAIGKAVPRVLESSKTCALCWVVSCLPINDGRTVNFWGVFHSGTMLCLLFYLLQTDVQQVCWR